MDIAFLIGRIIIGLYWIHSGFSHFAGAKNMIPYARVKGVPLAELAVPGTGVLLLVGGLSIITGVLPILAVAALAAFLIPVTFMMHNFWAATDPGMKMNDTIAFTKNMALLGYTLVLLAIPTPWAFSLGS
jgi:uncharacterized membrane protein YphA (DoxX/SURF4 family)